MGVKHGRDKMGTRPLKFGVGDANENCSSPRFFHACSEAQALRLPGHQISWVSEGVRDFSPWTSSAMEAAKKNEIWHKGSLGDEDDARTFIFSNTRRESA